MGQKVYLIQAKKKSFVEMGKNAAYSIWGVRVTSLHHAGFSFSFINENRVDSDQTSGRCPG